jgi:hypothetical protein
MDIRVLLNLGCAKVAALIKGLPLEKIKAELDPALPHDDKGSPAPASKDTEPEASKDS